MKTGLEQSTQTFPEINATNANFTRMSNLKIRVSGGCNRDVMQTMAFLVGLFSWIPGKRHDYCAKTIVFGRSLIDGLSKTVVRALPYGIVWVDEPTIRAKLP